jgi:hypothetical protein
MLKKASIDRSKVLWAKPISDLFYILKGSNNNKWIEMVHKGLWNYMTSTIIAIKNVNMPVIQSND